MMINKQSLLITGASLLAAIAVGGAMIGIVHHQTGLSITSYLRSLRTNRLSIAEFQALEKENLLVIDVRTEVEHQFSHIPGSTLIPIQDLATDVGISRLEQEINRMQTETGQLPQIVFYCQTGPRSIQAFEMLTGKIMPEMSTLTGGMAAWEKVFEATSQLE